MIGRQFRLERRRLAHRRRRIIFNNDGDDFYHADNLTSAEQFLAQRYTGLENTHVDTVSYCVIGGFPLGNHHSKVCDNPGLPGRDSILAPHAWDDPRMFIAGRDCLEVVVDFCRRNEIEVWASIRMNDNHDQWTKARRTPWKNEHPERWLAQPPDLGGGIEEKCFWISEAALAHPARWITRGSYCRYYGANYERADVRDKMFEMIEDVCRRYDLDGIELDFLRNSNLFGATARGEPDAGDGNRALLTELIRHIRVVTEEVGLKRGCPMVIAVRVPDDPGLASAYGMDTPQWLCEELIDIIIAGESARIRPWKEFAALGHSHGAPVYACACENYTQDVRSIRGRALAALAAGVDGIYTFNHFDPKSPVWGELGDADLLTRRDRITPVCNAIIRAYSWNAIYLMPDVERFLSRPPRLPLELPDGSPCRFEFEAGEQGIHIAGSSTPHAALCLRFGLLEAEDTVEIALNGMPLHGRRDLPAPGWITCGDAAPALQWGDNALMLTVRAPRSKGNPPPKLVDLELKISAKPESMGETGAATQGVDVAKPMPGWLGRAFDLADGDVSPSCHRPSGRILAPARVLTALQQWLIDELQFALPRVPVGARIIADNNLYPEDPIEKPLPGWHSLAVLFDADKLPDPCERDLLCAFFKRLKPDALRTEAGMHAGHMAGTRNLAVLLVRSASLEDLETVAAAFAEANDLCGILPQSVRFLRADSDGHRIARAFMLVLRGTAQNGVFRQAKGLWPRNRLTINDAVGTGWRVE